MLWGDNMTARWEPISKCPKELKGAIVSSVIKKEDLTEEQKERQMGMMKANMVKMQVFPEEAIYSLLDYKNKKKDVH